MQMHSRCRYFSYEVHRCNKEIALYPTRGFEPKRLPVSCSATSRRALLAGSLFCIPLVDSPNACANDIQDYINRVFPPAPEPVMFPRKALNQPFAVLLMRSAYETVDDLDFIPMNEFQKAFWKLRASEQEAYNLQYSPLKPRIGDITDSLYFDFISYSQFSTIAREMPKGQQVFKEYCEDCPEGFRVVRRDASLYDNDALPGRFFTSAGDRIYTGLKDGFRGTQFGGPAPLPVGAPLTSLAAAVQRLLDVMVVNGYALKAEVYDVNEQERSFKVKVTGPANLWGLQSLNHRRSLVLNTYDAMAIDAFLRASGRYAVFELSTSGSGVDETWLLAAA